MLLLKRRWCDDGVVDPLPSVVIPCKDDIGVSADGLVVAATAVAASLAVGEVGANDADRDDDFAFRMDILGTSGNNACNIMERASPVLAAGIFGGNDAARCDSTGELGTELLHVCECALVPGTNRRRVVVCSFDGRTKSVSCKGPPSPDPRDLGVVAALRERAMFG